MARFILGRLLQALVTLWMVVTVVFFLARLAGDPIALLGGEHMTAEFEAELRARYGLDKPVWQQYLVYLGQIVRGDFGTSIVSGEPALAQVLERWPATVEIGAVGILISLVLALPIGVYAAAHRGSPLDYLARGFAVFGQAVPGFWVGLIFILIFAVELHLLPAGGRGGPQHVILPALTTGWFAVAGIMRLTRSSMLEVLGSEYVKLARAKGLPMHVVVWKHAFRNAAIPVLTFTALVVVSLFLTGSIVAETVFSYPGVGSLLIDAVRKRDFPQLQAAVLFLSALYVLVNLSVDLLYGYLDPRIRAGHS
jgi:peptide/nickel transport system permease protein